MKMIDNINIDMNSLEIHININIVCLLISHVLIGEADFKLDQSHLSHNTTSLCVLCAQMQTFTQPMCKGL